MIQAGRRVKILFTLKLEDGTVIDSSDRHGAPLEFILGDKEAFPGLNRIVNEMSPGEKRQVCLPAVEAYGSYDDGLIEAVPLDNFPDADRLPVGEYITISSSTGKLRVKVARIENGHIYFDLNHELAGQDLFYTIELIEVFGVTGSLVENELHAEGCSCGCHKVREALSPGLTN